MDVYDWGYIKITLDEYIAAHGISKNKLALSANLQRTQLLAYCRNEVQRPDLNVLSRICYALDCQLSDIMRYYPPSNR